MENPASVLSKSAKEGSSLEKAGFDRLKPRHSTNDLKRKASSSVEHDDIEDENSAKVRKTEFKKEYTKLRKLVPALNARDDITKVEIIEETIRYIDALHHQLAARLHSQNSTSNDEHQNEPNKREGKPLRQLGGVHQNPIQDQPDSRLADNHISSDDNTTASSRIESIESSSSSSNHSQRTNPVPDSTQETSIKDLKAAVENIQKLFSIHLMESQPDDDDNT